MNSTSSGGVGPQIDREIYAMPMFVTFPVPDFGDMETFYHCLGFITLATIPDETGETSLIHLRRQRYQDILLVRGEAEPGSTSTTFAAHGEDLEAIAQQARAEMPHGAAVTGPVQTPWFTNDLQILDPCGNKIVFTKQITEAASRAQEWTKGFGGEFTDHE